VAPERCLKISTAILSACRCLSNDDISNSIRAIAVINPPSTTGGSTGGSLLGLAGNSSGAAGLPVRSFYQIDFHGVQRRKACKRAIDRISVETTYKHAFLRQILSQ
jgi:hypothetical protein